MKKTIISIVMIVVLASLALGALETNVQGQFPHLRITLVNQEPDPVEPGEYVDIRWKFENIGGANAEDVEVQLIAGFPFALDPGVSAVKKIGSIHGRQDGDVGTIVKYRVRVDPNAVEGVNEINFKYRYKGTSWITFEDPFEISVQSRQAILGIEDVTFTPKAIAPGNTNKVLITIKNLAESMLKDINVKLDLTNLPFAPVGSSNEKTVDKLSKGIAEEVSFNLIADSDAVSKVHKVPLLITYTDEIGTAFSKNSTVGLVVRDEPSYLLNLEETDIYTNNAPGKAIFSISNVGTSEIKFLYVKVLPSDDYEIISQDMLYLGNIESDDFETVEFSLFITSDKKEVPVLVEVNFKDSYNQEYTAAKEVMLKIYGKSDAVKYGLTAASNKIGIFLVLIIVVGGYYGYKRWKKKRK